MSLWLFLAAFVVLLLLRIPVAVSMLAVSGLYFWLSDGMSLGLAVQRLTAGVDSFPLLAVPLFVMVGQLANESGISDRLFDAAEKLLGHIRGSLGYVNVGVSFAFSGMSGAAVADAAGLGEVEVPAMIKRGYSKPFAIGITGASSILGPIMPPSIPAILYAVTAGASIGGLFVAGVVPAAVLGIVLCVAVYWHARTRTGLRLKKSTWSERGRAVLRALAPALTPILILGGIVGGIVTPTESAALAALYMLILGLVYRRLTLHSIRRILVGTSETTAMIMFIVAAASLFGFVLAREQAPQAFADAVLQLSDNPIVLLLLLNLILLFVGMIMEPASAILVMVPVLLPVAFELGMDPLHFGIVVLLNLMIGLLTPPVGLVLYVLSSVTKSSVNEVARASTPFLVPLAAALLVITFVPSVTLWLPRMLGL